MSFHSAARALALVLLALPQLFPMNGWAAPGVPGVIEIADPSVYRRVLAVSDVHGMFTPLKRLLRGAGVVDENGDWAAGPTLLVVVGDSIDKGPDSLDVLDTWMRLSVQARTSGGGVLTLLGNHEAEFLADPRDDEKAKALYDELKRKGLDLSELTDPSRPRARFLRSLPVAARVGRWIFCHAGLVPDMSWSDFVARANAVVGAGRYGSSFLVGGDSILEAKGWWDDDETRGRLESRLAAQGFSGVVFGHQPAAFGVEGELAAADSGHLIKIDNGMAPEAGAHAGHLLVFANPGEMALPAPPHVFSQGQDGQLRELTQVRR